MNNTNTPPPATGNSRSAHIPTFPVQATWTQNRPQNPRAVEEPPAHERRSVGPRTELGRYVVDEQQRVIIGQRVDGVVRVSDVPDSRQGRAYLIERELQTKAELDALVADYLTRAHELGAVPMAVVPVKQDPRAARRRARP